MKLLQQRILTALEPHMSIELKDHLGEDSFYIYCEDDMTIEEQTDLIREKVIQSGLHTFGIEYKYIYNKGLQNEIFVLQI